ncbi:hypothetical protein MXB_2174 [Myxobolus squamalis]|nr:hypothetical protein MXB_2174 [Myxobolus squamalis]
MRKKLSDEGFFCRYNTTPNFELAARMIVAIAFFPSHRIDSALEMLLVELPDDLKVILNWFEGSYVGCLVRGVRCGALFPFHMWSVYECTLRSLNHTNNHAEAAHCQIRAEFGMEHPTLWKFIDGIRTIRKGHDQYFERYIRGNRPPQKCNKGIVTDEKILRIVETYDFRNILDYLRGLAHNFLME